VTRPEADLAMASTVGRLRRPLRACRAGLVSVGLAAVLAVLASCTVGGGDGRRGEMASAAAPTRTPPTEPPATDPEAIRPYLEDLLARYEVVLNQVVADPSVASDRAHPLIGEYLDLFEPGSQFTEDALAAWADDGEEGRSVQPYDGGAPAYVTRVDGDVEVLARDEVVFQLCVERRMLVYEHDVLRQQTPYFADPGSGMAVRVDGVWRLRSLGLTGGQARCGGAEDA
jgi:hypothetical protein